MKNTFGNALTVTLFGESHGSMIGAVLDGLAPGITVDDEAIRHRLALRRPHGKIATARREDDPYLIVSGVFNQKTTGTPLTLLIPNEKQNSRDYAKDYGKARPGHADYTAFVKYHGFEDYRGGGHFSGRITAPLVAVGAILQDALSKKGITIGTHVKRCAGIDDAPFQHYKEDIEALNQKTFAVLDDQKEPLMVNAIEKAASEGDSVGGILETVILGVPAGVGEPWFDSVESMLSHALFSIGGVKGVAFGDGFAIADKKGSEANDGLSVQNGRVTLLSNHSGGINGGITNGMPIVFETAVRPTPSIFKEQETVDLLTGDNTLFSLTGRHDPCIVHRVRAVVDAVAAIVVADLLTQRFGTDYLADER